MKFVDIETYPIFIAGVYDNVTETYVDLRLEEFKQWLQDNAYVDDKWNPSLENAWVLHNFEGFDKFIINKILKFPDCSEDDLKELSDFIINEKTKPREYYQGNNIVIDTISYVKKSLKDYALEHGLKTSKFDFENNESLDDLKDYLESDVMNTYHIYINYVEAQLGAVYQGWDVAGFDIKLKKIASNSQSGKVLANELIGTDTTGIIDGDYDLNFKDLNNIPLANKWYKRIDWDGDKYTNCGESSYEFNWKDNNFTIGFGGIHSHNKDSEFRGNLYHLDISSYYPNLIKLLLDGDYNIRKTISQSYFDIMNKRLELKKQGDPANNSLKLFINSIYGLLWARGYETKIHNPLLQVMVCLMGQYKILELFDMFVDAGIEFKIVQSNTDGIIIQTTEIDNIESVRKNWEFNSNNYLTFDVDPINYYYGEDVNNYFLQYENGSMKAKGRFKFKYDVNTKYDEIRHNLALNKLFINNKIGEDILELKDSDYAITPTNRTKKILGTQLVYLNRDGNYFLNKSFDSIQMPGGMPILVSHELTDYDYYSTYANGGTAYDIKIDKYSSTYNNLVAKGYDIVASGYDKKNLKIAEEKLADVHNTLMAGGLSINKDPNHVVIDFDTDTQEEVDNLPKWLREIYNDTMTEYDLKVETSHVGFRKKIILQLQRPDLLKKFTWKLDNVEIYVGSKRIKIYGNKSYDTTYKLTENGNIGIIVKEYEDILIKQNELQKEQKRIARVEKKTREMTGEETYEDTLTRGSFETGYCSEDDKHRGTPFFDKDGNLGKYCCLHSGCKNFVDDCNDAEVLINEIVVEKPVTPVVPEIKNKFMVPDTAIRELFNSINDLESQYIGYLDEDGKRHREISNAVMKNRINLVLLDWFKKELVSKNSVFDVEAHEPILKHILYNMPFEMEYKKLVTLANDHSTNTELKFWGEEIKYPQMNADMYDPKTNKFREFLMNLATNDLHTFNQLEFFINTIFNEQNNRFFSVFVFLGVGGNGKGFLTDLIQFMFKEYETTLVKAMRPTQTNTLIEGKLGGSSTNCIITRLNEVNATSKLDELLKDWYEEQSYRKMGENKEGFYKRLSIPVLLSNNNFSMTGGSSVTRRQVRILFSGTLKELSEKNNPLWMKDMNGRFEHGNIREDFMNDFWEYANWTKDIKMKRPDQSIDDKKAMNMTNSLVADLFKDIGIKMINEKKVEDKLESFVKSELGFYVSGRKITSIVKKELGWTNETKNVDGKSQRIYVETVK